MEFSSRLLSSLLLLTLTFSAQAFVPEASELQQQKFKHGWIAPYKQEYASQYLQDISYGFNNNRYGIFDDIPLNSEYDLLNYLANLKTFTLKFIKLNLFFERL